MTIYEKLKSYLEVEPRGRLRKNKNRAIGNLISKQYGLEIDKNKMADMVGEILSADRAWRKVLEDNEHLRGEDYNQKQILEENKMLELGYSPNFHKDNKTLKLL